MSSPAVSARLSPSTAAHPYRRWYGPADHGVFWRRVAEGGYRAVHLATPPWVTGKLALRLAGKLVGIVSAEKPWAVDLEEARRLAEAFGNDRPHFVAFDHYLERPIVRRLKERPLREWLGGPPLRITGRLWESELPDNPSQGRTGMLSDLLIHLLSVTYRLLPAGTHFEVTDAEAARHTDSPYQAETFARVQMEAYRPDASVPVSLDLSAAKGVDDERAEKQIEFEAAHSRLEIDFSSETARLFGPDGNRAIAPTPEDANRDAYAVLLQKLAVGNPDFGFGIEEAVEILTVLESARDRFPVPLPVLPAEMYPPR